jgi:hypothetical protein
VGNISAILITRTALPTTNNVGKRTVRCCTGGDRRFGTLYLTTDHQMLPLQTYFELPLRARSACGISLTRGTHLCSALMLICAEKLAEVHFGEVVLDSSDTRSNIYP